MPSEQDHFEQAESNERAAKKNEREFPDWSVTICFYAALHWVERYAKSEGTDIGNEYDGKSPHDRRRKYVADIAQKLRSRTLRNAYEDLERESKRARYLQNLDTNALKYYTKSQQKVSNAFQKLQIVRQQLSS